MKPNKKGEKMKEVRVEFEKMLEPHLSAPKIKIVFGEWFERAIDKAVEEERKEIREKIIKLAEDHYWDGLSEDKNLIVKHLKYILKLI